MPPLKLKNKALPLVLTAGDPSSIATFISLKSWLALKDSDKKFFMVANYDFMQEAIAYYKLDIKLYKIHHISEVNSIFSHSLPIWDIDFSRKGIIDNILGVRDFKNSRYVLDSLNKAIDLSLNKEVAGIITNPLDKDLVNQYLISEGQGEQEEFLGHTGYLAKKSKVKTSVMMMGTPYNNLKVIPLTTHIPLKDVSLILTKEKIIEEVLIIDNFFKRYLGIKSPRLLFTGLNPHSGEHGLMGREEIDVIIPAINFLKDRGVNIVDMLPADTAFTKNNENRADVIIGMYHDQVLAPFKALYFDEGVNITLGLPFIRTSPDHGTAFNLAKGNLASHQSLCAAIIMAKQLGIQDE